MQKVLVQILFLRMFVNGLQFKNKFGVFFIYYKYTTLVYMHMYSIFCRSGRWRLSTVRYGRQGEKKDLVTVFIVSTLYSLAVVHTNHRRNHGHHHTRPWSRPRARAWSRTRSKLALCIDSGLKLNVCIMFIVN